MCGSWASNSWFEEEVALAEKDRRYSKEPQDAECPQRYCRRYQEYLTNHVKDVRRIDFRKVANPMFAKHSMISYSG